jgi:hypothetical protein
VGTEDSGPVMLRNGIICRYCSHFQSIDDVGDDLVGEDVAQS